jgi:hypothetical protein
MTSLAENSGSLIDLDYLHSLQSLLAEKMEKAKHMCQIYIFYKQRLLCS